MKEALKLALEALEKVRYRSLADKFVDPAIIAIKEALAQPEQEPVAIYRAGQAKGEPFHVGFFKALDADEVLLYTAPPAAQPEQEPVAWEQFYPDIGKPQLRQEPVEDVVAYHSDGTRTVRIAPKRPWVGLTDEQIWKFWSSRPEVLDGEDDGMEAEFVAAVRRVLAAHDIGAKP